jgi:hypothetical protein
MASRYRQQQVALQEPVSGRKLAMPVKLKRIILPKINQFW